MVIGGGIVGCYTAYLLARCGRCVTLVERDEVGGKASGNNPGGLNPLHGPGLPGVLSPLAERAFQLNLENWEPIARMSGIEFSPRRVSRLELAFDSAEKEALLCSIPHHDTIPGFSARWMERSELLERDSRVNPEVVGGLWIEGNGMVESEAYTRAVARAAETCGASLVRGEVTGLASKGNRISGVRLGSEVLEADSVVISTGSWVAEAGKWLGFTVRASPLKGELLLAEMPGEAVDHHVSWKAVGLYQTPGSSAWLGGTQDAVGFDENPSEEGRRAVIDGVARLVPAARDAKIIRHLVGLRPVTPDGLPILGKVPGWENACLATGSGTKGMLLGAGMAEVAARLLTGEALSFSIDPYRAERFDG